MKLLTAALSFTVFFVTSPVASGTQLVKENLSIKKECPTIKNYTGNWCLDEAANPTPANLVLDIIKSLLYIVIRIVLILKYFQNVINFIVFQNCFRSQKIF